MPSHDPKWLDWAKRLQALAQNTLNYTDNHFEIERAEAVRAIADEIVSEHSDVTFEQARDLFAAEPGHATPKVDVRGVVFRDNAILLVREIVDGGWTLPGGWADPGEPPSIATVREVFEESGYRTRAVKLLAVLDRSLHGHPPHPFHIYKLFFLCELLDGKPTHSIETDGVGFFAEDDLPPLSLSRVTEAQIHRLFEHHRNPDWPTDFD